jgi:hypothetical protein
VQDTAVSEEAWKAAYTTASTESLRKPKLAGDGTRATAKGWFIVFTDQDEGPIKGRLGDGYNKRYLQRHCFWAPDGLDAAATVDARIHDSVKPLGPVAAGVESKVVEVDDKTSSSRRGQFVANGHVLLHPSNPANAFARYPNILGTCGTVTQIEEKYRQSGGPECAEKVCRKVVPTEGPERLIT